MAWTELTRAQHNRKTERYPSDLTDEEWAVVCPLLPGGTVPVDVELSGMRGGVALPEP